MGKSSHVRDIFKDILMIKAFRSYVINFSELQSVGINIYSVELCF